MNIITFSQQLQLKLKKIDSGDCLSEDVLKTGSALNQIREIIRELKHFISQYTFTNSQEEIHFFKSIKPIFMSQYHYHKKRFAIELSNSFKDKESRTKNLTKHLEKMQNFIHRNMNFYQYIMSNATHFDTCYFLRNNQDQNHMLTDEAFSTGYDNLLSKFLANELLKKNIHDAMLQGQQDTHIMGTKLAWTASKVSLVELIYALHVAGVFHPSNDLKKIAQSTEIFFSVDLGNYTRTFSEIRIRKNGRTNFLDLLREKLIQRMDDLD